MYHLYMIEFSTRPKRAAPKLFFAKIPECENHFSQKFRSAKIIFRKNSGVRKLFFAVV
ncbi:Uncharacterized protein dnm_087270 [Desulfonema magnum]|uniref:Uncharacterized protein n=1 Tax=Desulfonema magnum TaxID=45655 RepID=A0A975GT14_9BACT|nr:Uncharacterized protein dnm_087270 [Desulfonema magnum]